MIIKMILKLMMPESNQSKVMTLKPVQVFIVCDNLCLLVTITW